ncbi:ATP-dependent endonuclease [uncultured Marinococcus sp.]|uniref:ATP-dependent nuclease n=1 Tax=uncultured Marinococcus sp. TaxID=487012 RepID=UPI002609D5DE|nr:AAA family ATPase [uncultured Marinococcus sp.]
MRLVEFSVKNYKIFKNEFSIKFSEENMSILTGRNNTGKSTILEALNHFYKKNIKANCIPLDCFSNKREIISMKAILRAENGEEYEIQKKYEAEKAAKFLIGNQEAKKTGEDAELINNLLENPPFYITPNMSPEDINKLIQDIYTDVLKEKLETFDKGEVQEGEEELLEKYRQVQKAVPSFLEEITGNVDNSLEYVSNVVSGDLQRLFSNQQLSIQISGGESQGFSPADIIKSTSSKVTVKDQQATDNMPLENQGTGLQRMSLIYLIQKLISEKVIGSDNKLLLIDEPEAFLHPEAIRALSSSLYQIGGNMPLIISTHSPILIDLSKEHSNLQVFRVSKDKAIDLFKSTRIRFEDDDIKNMKVMNYVDSHVSEFFFADNIIIVEGDTEYLAFQHFAEVHDKNVHILRARGKDTICTLMKILNQFNTSYAVLHDADNHQHYASSQYQAQETKCKNIFDLSEGDNGIYIYCANKTFEVAIGHEELSSKNKTAFTFELIHNPTDENKVYRKKTENLFLNILDRETNSEEFSGEFNMITCYEDIEKHFQN